MSQLATTFHLLLRAATGRYIWCAALAPVLLAFGLAFNARLQALDCRWLEWSPFGVRANVALLPLRRRFVWLPYALALGFAMPFLALVEECVFRAGTASVLRGVLWGALAFGAFHLMSLVSIRMAIYLTVVGALLTALYAVAGLTAVFVVHATYNLTALAFTIWETHHARRPAH